MPSLATNVTTPPKPDAVADTIAFMLGLPEDVCINELVLRPTAHHLNSTVAPLLGLQVMDAATSRIRIATAVLNRDLRRPRVEHRHRGEADGRRGCVGVRR
jgi:hypothetical protein